MKYYRFQNQKLFRICFGAFLFALILLARSTLFTSTILGFYKAQFIMIGLVAVAGLTFLIANRKNLRQIITDKRMLIVAASAIIMLCPMLVKRDWQIMYFTILLSMLFAVFLTYFTTLEEVAWYYVLFMSFLGAYSVLGQFVLKFLAAEGILTVPELITPGGWPVYHFGLTFTVSWDTMRNFGIFREPGLYQFFLMVAIHLTNYNIPWKKDWQMWAVNAVLMITLVTTFATGGVLALVLYVPFLFFDKGFYKEKRFQIVAAVLVVLCIVVVLVGLQMDGTFAYELIGMVEKVFRKFDSFTDRINAIVADIWFFIKNPIFGETMQEVLYSVPNNTASTLILFAVLGVAGGCIHVLSWMAWLWKKERHILGNCILMVIMFVPFNTQNVIHEIFFWLFPYMALVEQILPRLKLKAFHKKG